MSSSSAFRWIRSNVLGLVAIFIALGGSAVAVQTAQHPADTKAEQAKKKKKGKPGPPGPQGPAGPAGTNGTNGTNGTPGTPGPSEAITHYNDAAQTLPPTGPFTIESVDLDPGAYLVLAKTSLDEQAAVDNGVVGCNLQAEHVNDLSFTRLGNEVVATGAAEVQDAVVSTQLTDTITVPMTVTFACTELSGLGTPNATETKITAVRLGSETHTTP